jgi:pyruvate/2-oxoglutarate dehydrogenase complex dihydrolipoamide acyltransferase (E2) component
LYEFGTTSLFLAIGKKELVREINSDGSVTNKKVLNIRLVVDERICDGYYFATAIKHFKRLIKHPESLLERPEYIEEDN